MPEISKVSEPRLVRIRFAETIYVWSIKLQKIIKQSRSNFNKNKCEICIPSFATARSDCTTCVPRFDKLKRHLLYAEIKFGRELMWSQKSEIPSLDVLERSREIGDLKSMLNEPILKIVFKSLTLIDYQNQLQKHFKETNCILCDLVGSKHKTGLPSQKTAPFLFHLAQLEREHKEYIVFKSNQAELSQFNSNSSNTRSISNSSQATRSSTSESPKDLPRSTGSSTLDSSSDLTRTTRSSSSYNLKVSPSNNDSINEPSSNHSSTSDTSQNIFQTANVESTLINRKRSHSSGKSKFLFPSKKFASQSAINFESPSNLINTVYDSFNSKSDRNSITKITDGLIRESRSRSNLRYDSSSTGQMNNTQNKTNDTNEVERANNLIEKIEEQKENKKVEKQINSDKRTNNEDKQHLVKEEFPPVNFDDLTVDEEIEVVLVDKLPDSMLYF